MTFELTVFLLALVCALACSVPGTYLVVAKTAMTVDALSHAMLPGVVIGFLISGSLSSPILTVTATLLALGVIWALNALARTGLIARHGTLGITLPPLLALAVLITTFRASGLHLDTHTVLLGDLNLVVFDDLCIAETCIGPKHLYLLSALFLLNLFFGVFYRKQLAAMIFDREFAQLAGLKPALFNGLLLTLTALTVTAAFAATGAILVLAFMILPAAAARLIVSKLPLLLPLAMLFALISASIGFWVSYVYNLPTSAGIAFIMSVLFVLVFTGYLVRHKRTAVANV